MFHHFFSDYLARLQEQNQQWWQDLEQGKAAVDTPFNQAMQEVSLQDTAQLLEGAAQQPAALLQVQMQWWEQQMQIWQNAMLARDNTEEVVSEGSDDKRFKDKAWQEDVLYNFIKQSYLLFGRTYMETIEAIEGLDDKTRERLAFFLSPSH